MEIQMNMFNKYSDQIIELIIQYTPQFLLAVATLFVGLGVIKVLTRALRRSLTSRDFDPSLLGFTVSLLNVTLKVLLFISVAGMIGVEMTSFIAILGAAGLAVGMALSGTLQNFAGGVMILIFRPFNVGDFIEAQGFAGSVKEIQIFNTILTTGDNKTVIIPNAAISSGSMINYSTQPTRRLDLVFGIGYEDNIDTAKRLLREIMDADDRIMPEPEPTVVVTELGANSVDLLARAWVKSADYWSTKTDTLETVKKTFDTHGISFPFPQRVVHLTGNALEKAA